MADEIVFYTNPQSRGAMTHWMLEEIGCPYRVEVKAFGPDMKTPDYLAINPMGKVPAIVHGRRIVTETGAILCYLADAFPAAKLAPPISERGAYYRWLYFIAGCAEPAMSNKSVGWDTTEETQRRFSATAATRSPWTRWRRLSPASASSRPTISPRPISSSPRSLTSA